jgi:hypothetical protein
MMDWVGAIVASAVLNGMCQGLILAFLVWGGLRFCAYAATRAVVGDPVFVVAAVRAIAAAVVGRQEAGRGRQPPSLSRATGYAGE